MDLFLMNNGAEPFVASGAAAGDGGGNPGAIGPPEVGYCIALAEKYPDQYAKLSPTNQQSETTCKIVWDFLEGNISDEGDPVFIQPVLTSNQIGWAIAGLVVVLLMR